MKPQICGSQNYNHQFRPRFIPGFASFFPLIWVYLKIRYTPKNSDRNACFSTKPNGTRFSQSFRFLRQGTFCNKKKMQSSPCATNFQSFNQTSHLGSSVPLTCLQMLGFIGGFDLALTEKFIGKEFLQ